MVKPPHPSYPDTVVQWDNEVRVAGILAGLSLCDTTGIHITSAHFQNGSGLNIIRGTVNQGR